MTLLIQAEGRLVASRPASSSAPTRVAAATLVEVFEATVASSADAPALDDGARCLTYAQLDVEARALASKISALDIGRGDRVGLRVPSGTVERYVAVLGVLLAGAAYVPVDYADPATRAEFVFSEADVCAVVGPGLSLEVRRPGSSRQGPVEPAGDCWVIFTSGSTGAPKGVVVTHSSAAAFVGAERTLWSVRRDDRVLAGLSVGFDASCEEMWLAWGNGAALVPRPRAVVQGGVDLGSWIADRGVTVVSTVPTVAVNRGACIETHLFHDRVQKMAPRLSATAPPSARTAPSCRTRSSASTARSARGL